MSINNVEKFRAKIAGGGICVGTTLSFSDPAISELFGDAGCDLTAVQRWRDLGVQWFSLAGDFGLLYTAAKNMLDQIRALPR